MEELKTIVTGENSYSIIGPAGAMHFENVLPSSEVAVIDEIGYINVTKALSLIPEGAEPISAPIDDNLLEHIALRDAEEHFIRNMTPKRRNTPILYVYKDGRMHVLDGVHRIRARHRHGLKTIKCFVLKPASLDHCRVKVTRELPDGTRIPIEMDASTLIKQSKTRNVLP